MLEGLSDGHTLAWAVLAALVASLLTGGAVWRILRSAARAELLDDLDRRYDLRYEGKRPLGDPFATRDEVNRFGEKVNSSVSLSTMAKDTADANTDRIIRLEEGNRLQWGPVQKALTELAHQVSQLATQMGEWRERESREMGTVSARLDGIDERLDRYEKHIRPER